MNAARIPSYDGWAVSSAVQLFGERSVEAPQELRDTPRRAETAQRLEGCQGVDQLGLVVPVAVVAVRRVDRDAGRLLGGVSPAGLLDVRVYLQGEGALGREDLQQVRQRRAGSSDHLRPENDLRVARDQSVEPDLAVDSRDAGRRARVSTHPRLSHRLRRRRQSQEIRYRRHRAPGVVLGRVGEPDHGVLDASGSGM